MPHKMKMVYLEIRLITVCQCLKYIEYSMHASKTPFSTNRRQLRICFDHIADIRRVVLTWHSGGDAHNLWNSPQGEVPYGRMRRIWNKVIQEKQNQQWRYQYYWEHDCHPSISPFANTINSFTCYASSNRHLCMSAERCDLLYAVWRHLGTKYSAFI